MIIFVLEANVDEVTIEILLLIMIWKKALGRSDLTVEM